MLKYKKHVCDNISLVVKCTMLHCQWSLQLSVTSATSYIIFFLNTSHRCIFTGNGFKYR